MSPADPKKATAAEHGKVTPLQPPKGRIEILDAAAIFAPLEAPDYLIEPIVRRGSLVELVAYGSSGKSWMAFDAALSVAAGVPWLERFPSKQGPALLLDFENGGYESRRRCQAISRARGLSSVQTLGLAVMPPLYMSDSKFEDALRPIAASRQLITIDTLRAASPGVDENDSSIRQGLDALRRVGEQTGCAFLVLVHSKKTSGAISGVDAREAGRGSSAIFDAADVVLHATYTEGEPLHVQQTKSRLGKPVAPFTVSITDTEDGGVLVSANDLAQAAPEASPADKFEGACFKVLEAVREWPGSSRATLREKLGIRNTTVGAALDRLARDGAVRNTGTKADPKWFPTGAGGQLDA
ncbi:MAG TPA: AAA family ATPase [Polyangiaceae bacterium]|nr:AAA family ATPase [Polyangiaceae bacterium]